MAFFDDLKEKALDLSRAGMAKGKQLTEIARLNLANTTEEDAIKKAYTEMGKLYYAERGMAPEAAYAVLCEKITASKNTIEENREKIAELKEEGGLKDEDLPPVEVFTPPEEGPILGGKDHQE